MTGGEDSTVVGGAVSALVGALTGTPDAAAWRERIAPGALLVDHTGATTRVTDAAGFLDEERRATPAVTWSVEWAIDAFGGGAAWLWWHLPDPDQADIPYDAPSLLVAEVGPDGRAGSIEIFGPQRSWAEAVEDWVGVVGSGEVAPDPAAQPHAPSHPSPPDPSPEPAVLEAVADALVTENWLDLVAWGARWHDHAGDPIQRWAGADRSERLRVISGSRIVLVIDHEHPAALVAHVDETGRVTYLDHLTDRPSPPDEHP